MVMEYFGIDSMFLLSGIVIGTSIANYRLKPRIRAELIRQLEGDIWCHQCRYLLHDNTSSRCPECGTDIPPDQRRLISQRIALGLEIDPGAGVE